MSNTARHDSTAGRKAPGRQGHAGGRRRRKGLAARRNRVRCPVRSAAMRDSIQAARSASTAGSTAPAQCQTHKGALTQTDESNGEKEGGATAAAKRLRLYAPR
ncbi:hypothetical protein BN2475_150071 [Paraburkholderia ribeironis]|uniref:Uncharacterized protein n=1 Tax=Paraburkholderia ribeironis TaxID=1247936 RepID=A0A1N7RTE7_9BURK|nr:hypothetical protein BN2475_150071 [Paraburkholderia ribeironis]